MVSVKSPGANRCTGQRKNYSNLLIALARFIASTRPLLSLVIKACAIGRRARRTVERYSWEEPDRPRKVSRGRFCLVAYNGSSSNELPVIRGNRSQFFPPPRLLVSSPFHIPPGERWGNVCILFGAGSSESFTSCCLWSGRDHRTFLIELFKRIVWRKEGWSTSF